MMADKTGFLLDTPLIYWRMTDDPKLGKAIRNVIARADIAISVASIWEMLLKNARGKLPLPQGSISESLASQGFRVLSITAAHAEETVRIPPDHADPFDRLLLATAQSERLGFLTVDSALLEFARTRGLAFATSGV